MTTLVPEKRKEKTTEGGIAVRGHEKELAGHIRTLIDNGIMVSLFIDPDPEQVEASKAVGATHIELHTGTYANAVSESVQAMELDKLRTAASAARTLGLRVNAGHGLTYRNVAPVAHLAFIEELNIGHSIISRAALVGIDKAVRDMLALIA
jgi:pyridoxine 5-phosphate synthase